MLSRMPSLIVQLKPTEKHLERNAPDISFRKKCLELLDDYESLQAEYLLLSEQFRVVQHRLNTQGDSNEKRQSVDSGKEIRPSASILLHEDNLRSHTESATLSSPRNSIASASPTTHGSMYASGSSMLVGEISRDQIGDEMETTQSYIAELPSAASPRGKLPSPLSAPVTKKLVCLDFDEALTKQPSSNRDGTSTIDPRDSSFQLGRRSRKADRHSRSRQTANSGPSHIASNAPTPVVTDNSTATTLLGEQIIPAFANMGRQQSRQPSFENYRTHKSIQEAHLFQADCGVFMPSSMLRIFWNLLIISCLMFEFWSAPFQLIFCEREALPASIDAISIATTTILFLDIALNFNTGYFKNGKIVMHRREIIRHYIKYWLLLDIISSIPWPFEGGGFLRWLRFGKVVRLVKAMRYVEFVRVVQALSSVHKGGISIDFRLRHFVAPFGLFLFLSVHAHVHGCIWAACQTDWSRANTFQSAVHHYMDCYLWAFGALTAGTWRIPSIHDTDTSRPFWWAACYLEVFVMWERICMLAIVIIWGVCQAHTNYHDYILLQKLKSDALEYLKRHNVSFSTQVQVMYILHETGSVRQKQRHFRDLMNNDLPVEVKRKICSELWSERLKSLELIDMMNRLHHHFLIELALLVRQEVFASKAIIFHYGDASIASYFVMDGSVVCITDFDVPEFVEGHWIGETALVNRLLRRRMTVMSAEITVLMAVPADGFHELLFRQGLVDQFQEICHEYLWKGLCGRCGALGHHNADSCPIMMENEMRLTGKLTGKAIWSSLPGAPTYRNSKQSQSTTPSSEYHSCAHTVSMASTTAKGGQSTIMQKMTSLASNQFLGRVISKPAQSINRDLQQFLVLHNLGRLIPTMSMLGFKTLQHLLDVQFEELNSLLTESGEHLAPSELLALSPKSINDFREKVARTVQRHIFGRRNYHYVFLSHSKHEAGTEASLMQKELAELIAQDAAISETHSFDVPVFLDSENLQNLKDIQDKVQKSHNLCVMLTKSVLTRPWVLVEIVTAVRASVQVIPVRVTKPGVEFEFPGEEFYEKISKGDFLDLDGQQILADAGVSPLEVESSLRELFRQIAVPYSPQNNSEIRQVELKAFLLRCRMKHADDK